jgi:hypothetical protein
LVRRAWLGAKGQRKRGKNADAENYEKCCNDFCLPDKDSLQSDLTGPGYSYTSDGRLQPEGKDAIRKRGMPQPVEGDAIALCFSLPGGSPIIRNSNFGRWLN